MFTNKLFSDWQYKSIYSCLHKFNLRDVRTIHLHVVCFTLKTCTKVIWPSLCLKEIFYIDLDSYIISKTLDNTSTQSLSVQVMYKTSSVPGKKNDINDIKRRLHFQIMLPSCTHFFSPKIPYFIQEKSRHFNAWNDV